MIVINNHDRLSPELARATAAILKEQGGSEEEVRDLNNQADQIEQSLNIKSCQCGHL